MTVASLVIAALLALAALALCVLAARRQDQDESLVRAIDQLLPQTQCEKCGFPGCKPYARAIVRGDAGIDQCPPGGNEGVHALADLLGREPCDLNPDFGEHEPRSVAFVIEADCIGCTKCIQACPVDAILGAAKRMHTVIETECTGCGLCLPPCPVDCIEMRPPVDERAQWRWRHFPKAPADIAGQPAARNEAAHG